MDAGPAAKLGKIPAAQGSLGRSMMGGRPLTKVTLPLGCWIDSTQRSQWTGHRWDDWDEVCWVAGYLAPRTLYYSRVAVAGECA
jgi:hypothetical protein